MSFCVAPDPMAQRNRTDELPVVQTGRAYSSRCHAVSLTVALADQTIVQAVPFVETWMSAVSPLFTRNQRWNRNVTDANPEQLMIGDVAYAVARLFG